MTLPISGKAGPRAMTRGSEDNFRQGYTGEMDVSDYLPGYAQQALDGVAYEAANQAAQAVSVALATTYTGIGLYNPLNSGVILLLKFVKYALSVAPVAIAPLGLISTLQTVAPTGMTLLTVQNAQVGNLGVGKGIPFSAATILTPVWRRQLVDGFTAAALPASSGSIDLKGDIAILPGGLVAVGALTAVTGLGSLSWLEVPIGS